jgi:tape measure domain-containing protein
MSEKLVIEGILNFDASQSAKRAKSQLEQQLAAVDVANVVSFDVLTKGNGGFNKRLDEQLKVLREIEKSSAKSAGFSISKALFTGAFEGIGTTFSSRIKQDLDNFKKIVIGEIPNILGGAGLDNALEDLSLKLFSIGADFTDSFKGIDSLNDLSKDVLPQVVKAFKEFSGDMQSISVADITKNFTKTLVTAGEKYVKDLGLTAPADEFIRRRTERFQQQALDEVYARAAEIIKQSAEQQASKGFSVIEDQLENLPEILGGANAPDVLEQSTKELVIAIGSYADATDGFRIAANIAKEEIISGSKEIAAIGVQSTDVAGKGAARGALKPIVAGYSREEVEMAAQAVAALSLKPNLKVKLFGEGGGGFIAERATNLLNLTNLKEKVQGTGVGTPTLPGEISAENFTKLIATNIEETIGNKIMLPLSKLGVVNLPSPERQVQGATSSRFEGYQNIPEFQQQLRGTPLPVMDESILKQNMIRVEQQLRDLFDTPIEDTIKTISEISKTLKNNQRFADEQTIRSVILYQQDLQNLINSPLEVLQKSFLDVSRRLVEIEDLTVAKSPDLDAVVTQTKIELPQIVVGLLKSISDSSSVQFKAMATDTLNEIERLVESDIFNVNVDPVIRRMQLLNRDLSLSAEQSIAAKDITAMEDIRKQTISLIKELRIQEKVSPSKDAIKEYRKLLGQLKSQLSENIDQVVKESTVGIKSILEPSFALRLAAKKVALRGREDINKVRLDIDTLTADIISNAATLPNRAVIGSAKGLSGAIRGIGKEMAETEKALFDAIPILKVLKGGIKNVAFPIAAVAAASQIPGAEQILGTIPEQAVTLADPFAQQIAQNLTESLPGFLKEFASSGISGSLDSAASTLAEIIAGQLVIGTAGKMSQAIQSKAFKALPTELRQAINPGAEQADLETLVQKAVNSTLDSIESIKGVSQAANEGNQKLAKSIEGIDEVSPDRLIESFKERIKRTPSSRFPRTMTPSTIVGQARDLATEITQSSQAFKEASQSGNKDAAAKLGLEIARSASTRIRDINAILDSAKQMAKSDRSFVSAVKQIEEYSRNVSKEINQINISFGKKIRAGISEDIKQEIFNEYKKTGDYAVLGFAQGLKLEKAAKVSQELGDEIVSSLKASLEIRSPSRRIIREVVNPIIAAISENLPKGFKKAADSAANALSSTLGKTSKRLINEYISNNVTKVSQKKEEFEVLSKAKIDQLLSKIKQESQKATDAVADAADTMGKNFNQGVKFTIANQIKQSEEQIRILAAQLNKIEAAWRNLKIPMPESVSRSIASVNEQINRLQKQRDESIARLKSFGMGEAKLPESFSKIKGQIDEFLTNPIENARSAFLKFAKIGGSALFGLLLVQFFDLQSAIFVVQDALRNFREFEGLSQVILNTATSAEVGTASIRELQRETDRLKVSFRGAIQGLGQLQSATQNTEAAAIVPDLTTGLLQASRVYNLSADQMSRANVAIAQSFSKGIVSQEELRGQLSEALPSAIQIAARAYGITTKELNKLISAGELSSEFFAKFARQLKAETAISAARSVGTLTASLTDLENQIQILQINLIKDLTPLLQIIVGAAANTARFLSDNIGVITLLTKVIGLLIASALAPAVGWLLKLTVNATGLSGVFSGLKTGILGMVTALKNLDFANISAGLSAIATSARTAGAAIGTFFKALAPTVLIALAIEGVMQIVSAFTAWNDIGKETRQSLEFLNETMIKNEAGTKSFANNVSIAAQNVQGLKDKMPVLLQFLDKLSGGAWNRAFANKAIIQQSELLEVTGKQIEEAINLLSQAQQQTVSSKSLEKTIELLIMGKGAIEQEKLLTGQLNVDKQNQLDLIDKLLPKLQKQLDLSNGISTTFGKINSQRIESLGKIANAEADRLTRIAVLEEEGLANQVSIERQKLDITLTRVSSELAAQKQALREIDGLRGAKTDDDKLLEEKRKTEAEITKLTKDKAEARIAIRKFENEQALKELDKLLKEIESNTADAAKREALLNQKKFNQGLISVEELARREQSAEMKALDTRKQNIEEQIALTENAAIDEEEIITRLADLKADLTDIELEKAKKVGEIVKERLEKEKVLRDESFEQEKTFLQQVITLEEARNNVLRAREGLRTTRDELSVARLERSREIIQRLNDDEDITSQERITLRKELSQLGITGASSVLTLTQQIANLEYSIIEQKAKAQAIENQQALKRLEIEQKIADIANKQAVIAAQEKVISVKQEVASATPEGRGLALEKLKLAEEALALAKERSQFEINRLKTEELIIQQQITAEQQRQNDLFKKLDLQRNISQSQTDQAKRLQTSLPSNSLIPTNNSIDLDAINKIVEQLKTTGKQTPSGANIFNITAPPGFDGRDIGREFAKANDRLQREIFK